MNPANIPWLLLPYHFEPLISDVEVTEWFVSGREYIEGETYRYAISFRDEESALDDDMD